MVTVHYGQNASSCDFLMYEVLCHFLSHRISQRSERSAIVTGDYFVDLE